MCCWNWRGMEHIKHGESSFASRPDPRPVLPARARTLYGIVGERHPCNWTKVRGPVAIWLKCTGREAVPLIFGERQRCQNLPTRRQRMSNRQALIQAPRIPTKDPRNISKHLQKSPKLQESGRKILFFQCHGAHIHGYKSNQYP
jgi:hypothetical protein